MKKVILSVSSFIKREPVLFGAFFLALASAFLVPPFIGYLYYLDLRVLCILFSLMLVVSGLKEAGLFHIIANRLLQFVHNMRGLIAALVGMCFFSSMLITNDVALITFVPLTVLLLSQPEDWKKMIPAIVLQTIAANMGSSLTPLGNPQNLYLYSISGITLGRFVSCMAIPVFLSFLLLTLSILLIRPVQMCIRDRVYPICSKQILDCSFSPPGWMLRITKMVCGNA